MLALVIHLDMLRLTIDSGWNGRLEIEIGSDRSSLKGRESPSLILYIARRDSSLVDYIKSLHVGMSESLTSYFPFDRALRATLSHLELILREAGDNVWLSGLSWI